MINNTASPGAPKTLKEAFAGWVFYSDLAKAIQDRPSVDDYKTQLLSSKTMRGQFQGWNDELSLRFSVVIPTYNSEKNLRATIESILAQNTKVEIVLVDGQSTDRTLETVEEYKEHVATWVSEPDQSMYDAINKGIALSTGNVVKILNSDDKLTQNSLVSAEQFFKNNGLDVCLRGPIVRIEEESEKEIEVCGLHSKAMTTPHFFPILHPSWYVPRKLYESKGLYLPYFKIAGDQEYLLHLNAQGVQFGYSDEPLVEFRAGGMSAGYSGLYEGAELNSFYLSRLQSAAICSEYVIKKARYRVLEKLVGTENAIKVWQFLKEKIKTFQN